MPSAPVVRTVLVSTVFAFSVNASFSQSGLGLSRALCLRGRPCPGLRSAQRFCAGRTPVRRAVRPVCRLLDAVCWMLVMTPLRTYYVPGAGTDRGVGLHRATRASTPERARAMSRTRTDYPPLLSHLTLYTS